MQSYQLFKAHPWHGISYGEQAPHIVTAFIEIVPTDTVKYEIDKTTGWLKVDRPQKFSNVVPTLYGFVPQTYCGETIADFCAKQSGRADVHHGDGDPLDICVLSEKQILQGGILLRCKPIGGLRLIDKGEADDKIIATLEGDAIYDSCEDIDDLPKAIIERLRHYFLTYKSIPGMPNTCEVAGIYGREVAHQVIRHSISDYRQLVNLPPEN